MKKIVSAFLILLMLASSLPALAAETVINESFDNPSLDIEAYGLKLSGGTAAIGEATDGGKRLSALIISDTTSEGTTALQKNFTKIKDVVAVELRFKITGSMNNFSVSIGEGITTLAKVDVSVQGQVSVTDGGEKRVFTQKLTLNSWGSVKFCYYPDVNRLDARFNMETFEGLKPYLDYSGDGVDYLLMQTNVGRPTVSIDYYIVEHGSGLDTSVRPIEPPYIDAPETHPVAGKINVCYNGTYKYFDYEPLMRNSRVLLPFRRTFEMLGMEISYNAEERSATGKNGEYEVKITAGSNTATVNGVSHTLDVTPQIIENSFYVPVRFISQSVGKNVDWEDSTRTVIINDDL